jgi:hypothetical protein
MRITIKPRTRTTEFHPLNPEFTELLLLRLAFLASTSLLSSCSVTHTQNQLMVSTNMKVKKTLFLRASPPQVDGAYPAYPAPLVCNVGCVNRDEEEEKPGVEEWLELSEV